MNENLWHDNYNNEGENQHVNYSNEEENQQKNIYPGIENTKNHSQIYNTINSLKKTDIILVKGTTPIKNQKTLDQKQP